ncbi:hypothetical protein EVC24_163 [Rhizobium phage RHph_I4]|nr:hypothetical protein EVC24_163 [Rhizobium phage RHph_I4]
MRVFSVAVSLLGFRGLVLCPPLLRGLCRASRATRCTLQSLTKDRSPVTDLASTQGKIMFFSFILSILSLAMLLISLITFIFACGSDSLNTSERKWGFAWSFTFFAAGTGLAYIISYVL